MDEYAEKLLLLEKLLFPPQLFLSPSLVVGTVKCSICNEDYETCSHIVGKAYVGQICHVTVRDVRKISEISIVKEPANKLARVSQFTEGGVTRDYLT